MPGFLGNILENLFGKPATVKYPFEKPAYVPGTRGELNFNMAKCDQCQDCERICPSAAIKVYPEDEEDRVEPIQVHLLPRLCQDMHA